MFARIFNSAIIRITLMLFALLSLTACGGGSSGKSNNSPALLEKSNDISTASSSTASSILSSIVNSSSNSSNALSISNSNTSTSSLNSSASTIVFFPSDIIPAQPTLLGGVIQANDLNLTVTTVTTFAGSTPYADGIGAAARFSYPQDITTDGTNLYVADSYNHVIRKVEIATGAVTILAGTIGKVGDIDDPLGITDCVFDVEGCIDSTKATFFAPSRITTDGTYVYVDNLSDSRLRKIEIATSSVTTIEEEVGIGEVAMASNGIYKTTDGSYIYVSDTRNFTISKIDVASGVKAIIAGTSGVSGSDDGMGVAARFFYPKGITVVNDNLYVADATNNTIRKIVISTGLVSTVAGQAGVVGAADGVGTSATFNSPQGLTTDGTNLYVADSGNDTIRKIEIASGTVTTIAGAADIADGTGSSARFYNPKDITSDGVNLYVTDTDRNSIRKVQIATGAVSTIAGNSGVRGGSDGAEHSATFSAPEGITTDGINLYVADTENNTIRKVELATGIVSAIAGKAGIKGASDGTGSEARFSRPTGITTNGTSLFLTDSDNHTIRKVEIASGFVSTIAGTVGSPGSADGIGKAAKFSFPNGVTTDGINLYVADSSNFTIRKIEIGTGIVTTLAGTATKYGSADGIGSLARFFYIAGITTDGTNLYVTDYNNRTIRKIVIATGLVSTIAGTAGIGGSQDGAGGSGDGDISPKARFYYPEGITTDGTSLYVTDTKNQTIRKIE